MRRKNFAFWIISVICFLSFPLKAQLIKDSLQLSHIDKQFSLQHELAKGRSLQLFEVFKQDLAYDEYQAMRFLYAYMPLSDLADYNGPFFLDNVKIALKAKSEMTWGKTIPEAVFLHFVLPVRVNNENLDSFRIVMYEELKKRVQNLSMKEAVLEVNHWCHEKVTYKGSDERTSSPLSSIRYSFGRCGEESTFTVSALRMVGIPARQVYTPRWAHSDDNHAWVEVWVDGNWYFLGACEPEPALNMGWFAAPAARTMLVHTRAYGWYNGPEPFVTREDNFSELNLIANYAPAKKLFVKVVDEKSIPVENAKVEYQLYNYAEFFPIAKNYTNSEGITSINMGLGDLIIWANKENDFGFEKISVTTTDTILVKISKKDLNGKTFDYDLVPPVERELVKVSDEGRKENDRRLKVEDSLRTKYMSTFKDSVWTTTFAKELGMNADSTVFSVVHSYGNWKEITSFLKNTSKENRKYALKLLYVVSEKDLRDTKASILTDYLNNALRFRSKYKGNEEIWAKYVLCGRVSSEMMVSCKELYNLDFFSSLGSNDLNLSPIGIKENILKKITIDNKSNALSRNPLTPVGVYELRVADLKSRDIFFVAMCRANGFAARLQPETSVPQYWKDNNWENVVFEEVQSLNESKGYVSFINKNDFDPKYNINFTLALFKKGVYRTLQFEEEKTLTSFAKSLEVPSGNYMLVTGNRQQDGAVLCNTSFLEIKPNETKEVEVKVRESKMVDKPWAKLDLNQFTVNFYKSSKSISLSKLFNHLPFVIIFIDPDKEPTKHVIVDLQPVKSNIEKWAGAIIFVLQPDKVSDTFKPEMLKNLPDQSVFVIDNNGLLLKEIGNLKSTSVENDLPVIIAGDEKGNLNYFSKGYRIGVGEQLIKKINK